MDISNKRFVISYFLITGFSSFILSAMLSAVFIVAIEQDKNWCLKSQQFQTGSESYETQCVLFKSSLEEYKSYHNQEMLERNKYLIGINFTIFFGITVMTFHFVPK